MAGGYLRFDIPYLSKLPIAKKISKELQAELIKLVNQLLQLNQEKQEIKLTTKLEQLQGKVDFCETQINKLVYQLYELTEEEIELIEAFAK